jgi:antitoxin component YwqK of YwqJK toxin-antitoxin module
MKNILSILLISVILFSCFNGNKRYHIDETVSPTDTLTYLKSNMKPLNGVVYCEFGENGKYINGKKDGEHRRWHNSGELSTLVNYKLGKKNGLCKSWNMDNQLEIEGNYTDNKSDGLWKYWFDNGHFYMIGNMINGKKDGIHVKWYKNGKLREKVNYINDKRDGIYKEWYKSGILEKEVNYTNGIVNSQRYFSPHGDEWDPLGDGDYSLLTGENTNTDTIPYTSIGDTIQLDGVSWRRLSEANDSTGWERLEQQ